MFEKEKKAAKREQGKIPLPRIADVQCSMPMKCDGCGEDGMLIYSLATQTSLDQAVDEGNMKCGACEAGVLRRLKPASLLLSADVTEITKYAK